MPFEVNVFTLLLFLAARAAEPAAEVPTAPTEAPALPAAPPAAVPVSMVILTPAASPPATPPAGPAAPVLVPFDLVLNQGGQLTDSRLAGAKDLTLVVSNQVCPGTASDLGVVTFLPCASLRSLGVGTIATMRWTGRETEATPGGRELPVRLSGPIETTPTIVSAEDLDKWKKQSAGAFAFSDSGPWYSFTDPAGPLADEGKAQLKKWKGAQPLLIGGRSVPVEAGASSTWMLQKVTVKEQSAVVARAKFNCAESVQKTRLYHGRVVCVDLAPDADRPFELLAAAITEPATPHGWSVSKQENGLRHEGHSLELLPGEWLTVVVGNAPKGLSANASAQGALESTFEFVDRLDRAALIKKSVTPAVIPTVPVQVFHFAPRPMGKVWRLELVQAGEDGKPITAAFFEVGVRKVYIGAVRIGVSMSAAFGDAEYEVVRWPGTSVSTVVDTNAVEDDSRVLSRFVAQPEIVLGYTGFCKPRAYSFGEPKHGQGKVGIYAGLGVLGMSGTSIEPLTSAYLGLEFEPVPDFGIVIAAVGRRGEALNYPYEVGSQVTGTPDSLTSTVFRPGVAVVFNLSPFFFRAHPTLHNTFTKPSTKAATDNAEEGT